MRCASLGVFISLPAALLSAGQEPIIQEVSSFKELVSSVSEVTQESIALEEQHRLRYCVSAGAVQSRKNAILDKARLIDPGSKTNGKQSIRVSTARLIQDIHDPKSLDNIILTAPFNGGDAHFTKIGLSYLYGRFYDQFPAKVQIALLEQASEYTKYFEIGTENHTSMRRMAATVFGAACPNMQTSYGITGKELESISTQWIRDYGKVVFRSGLKEYLSPIYLGVHNEIWLTGAECGPNSEVRSMSRAVLDWIWTDLAINSHFGQVIPPVTRAKVMLDLGPQASIPTTHAQYLSWIYWGNLHSTQIEDRLPDSVQSFHPGMTSSDMVNISEGFQTALLPSA